MGIHQMVRVYLANWKRDRGKEQEKQVLFRVRTGNAESTLASTCEGCQGLPTPLMPWQLLRIHDAVLGFMFEEKDVVVWSVVHDKEDPLAEAETSHLAVLFRVHEHRLRRVLWRRSAT